MEVSNCPCPARNRSLAQAIERASESESKRRSKDLPKDIALDILVRLPLKSLLRIRCVSRFWRSTIDGYPYRLNTIFNILSKLPVKSLLCFRCVSKLWCHIIDSPFLAVMHFNRAQALSEGPQLMLLLYTTSTIPHEKTVRLYDRLEDGDNILRAPSIEYPTAMFTNSDEYSLNNIGFGMFFFRSCERGGPAFLCNPHRGELMMLPPGMISIPCGRPNDCCGFGYDSTTITYKVVRVFFTKQDWNAWKFSFATEVYTLGTRSWREISSVPPHPIDGCAVYAYGDAHWKICSLPWKANGSGNGMIVSFDMKKEEFKLTPTPEFRGQAFKLLDLRGSLAIVDFNSSTQIDTWVLKDYDKNQYWAREYKIELKPRFGFQDRLSQRLQLVGAWEHGVVFSVDHSTYFYYFNLEARSMRYMRYIIPMVSFTSGMLISCTRSLVSLKKYGNLLEKEPGPRNCFDLKRASPVSILQ